MLHHSALPKELLFYLLVAVTLLNFLFAAEYWISVCWKTPIDTHEDIHHADWQRLVFSPKTSSFELSLAVQVVGNSHGRKGSSEQQVQSEVFQKSPSQKQRYTFEEMAEIKDENWVQPIPRQVYLLYPQALDMKRVLFDINSRRPIPEAPIFNQTIRYLNVSSTVCVPGKAVTRPLDAIVMVKSAVYNFEDRDRFRKAYATEAERETDFQMAMIFSVGLPRSRGGRFFQRDGFNISLPGRAGDSMEKMESQRPEVLRKLAEEARINGDLVVGDYEDTYYNLSLKLFHTFQWASRFCRAHFTSQKRPPVFILLDDDYAFNVSILRTELEALPEAQRRRVTLGWPINNARVIRHLLLKTHEKWSLSKQEVPWPTHPRYAPTIFLAFGADVMQEIALAMYFTKQFPIDDAWLGMVMTKLDLHPEPRRHMYIDWPKNAQKDLVLFAPFDYLFGSK